MSTASAVLQIDTCTATFTGEYTEDEAGSEVQNMQLASLSIAGFDIPVKNLPTLLVQFLIAESDEYELDEEDDYE